MESPLEISLVVLCALVVLETLVLRAVAREATWLIAFYGETKDAPHPDARLLGAAVPDFKLSVLDSADFVTKKNLFGEATVLLFGTRQDVIAQGPREFRAVIDGARSRSDECLYLVCEGTEDDACWMRDTLRLRAAEPDHVRILVAGSSTLRRQFGIGATPSSVVVDELGKISMVGRPMPRTSTSAGASA